MTKVPLDHEPFPALQLSREQEEQLKWLADAIIDETLAEYDEFTYVNDRALERDKWKQVMSRENVTIYKRAGKGDLGGATPDVSLDQPQRGPGLQRWHVPRVVGLGTIAGTLEDSLYGWLAMTKTETTIRTSYMKDEVGDNRVLAHVVKPTEQDPLRSVLLRWQLYMQPLHKTIIAPRDIVNMESVGTRILPSGIRVGYICMQSVEVPGCGELKRLGIVRCKISSCFLFRDAGNGTIEQFMRGFVDPGGRMGDRMAILTLSVGLITSWRLTIASQSKKLVWLMLNAKATQADQGAREPTQDPKNCPICSKSMPTFRTAKRCDVCLIKACARCVDKKTLSHPARDGGIMRVDTRVCKTCVMTAAKTSAREASLSEQLPLAYRAIRNKSFGTSSSCGSISKNSGTSHQRSVSSTIDTFDCETRDTSTSDDLALSLPESRLPAHSIAMVNEKEEDMTVHPDQLQLWIRMNQLRIAAEETYLLAKENTTAMLETEKLPAQRLI